MSVGPTTNVRQLEYLVLPDAQHPWLLACVRWPDVYQAMSPTEPVWRADPGLFDLPHDPCSVAVTAERAAAIAERWGARLPAPDGPFEVGPSLLRRMPANWSMLSPAERRAWSLDLVPAKRREVGASRWWARRRRPSVVTTVPQPVIDLTTIAPDKVVIDLRDDELVQPSVGVEHA